MKVNVEKLETNRVRMDIEVDAADFSRAVDRAYRKLVQNANIPGFRKGKAPRHIFDRHVGKAALLEEAFDAMFPQIYADAILESGIRPVDQPDVEINEIDEGKPLRINTTVTVKPEVTLGEYDKISIPAPTVEITDAEVDAQVEHLLERHAQLVPVEGPVENGHMVTLDFEGSIDGENFPGGTASDYQIEVGSGGFIPGYEEQMVGMQKGETRDISVTFPEDYHAEHLAAKDAVFKTTIKEIKRKELPKADDEFAKSTGTAETLEALRQTLRERMLEDRDRTAKRAHQNEVVRKAVDESEVEIPDVMVDREAAARLNQFVERLGQLGMNFEDYCAGSGQHPDTIQQEMRDGARWQVKTDLVIEAIAKKEGFEATEEEIDASVSEIAERYKQEPEQIRALLMSQDGLQGLRETIIGEKTVEFMVRRATENAEANPPGATDSDAVEEVSSVTEVSSGTEAE